MCRHRQTDRQTYVLSHDNFGLSAKLVADVVHLLGSDIVSIDHEALVVLTQEAVQAGDVLFLTGSGKRHFGLSNGEVGKHFK